MSALKEIISQYVDISDESHKIIETTVMNSISSNTQEDTDHDISSSIPYLLSKVLKELEDSGIKINHIESSQQTHLIDKIKLDPQGMFPFPTEWYEQEILSLSVKSVIESIKGIKNIKGLDIYTLAPRVKHEDPPYIQWVLRGKIID